MCLCLCLCLCVCARFKFILSVCLLNALYHNRWMLVTPPLTADYFILLLATGGLDPACPMRMVLDYLIPPVLTIDMNIYTVPGNRYVSEHCYCCKLQSTTWYTVHTAVCSLDLAMLFFEAGQVIILDRYLIRIAPLMRLFTSLGRDDPGNHNSWIGIRLHIYSCSTNTTITY